MDEPMKVTMDLPVEGELIIRFPDGRDIPVTEQHLLDLGYIPNMAAYSRFSDWLNAYLDGRPCGWINTIRYGVECAVAFYGLGEDHMPDWNDPADCTDGPAARGRAQGANLAESEWDD